MVCWWYTVVCGVVYGGMLVVYGGIRGGIRWYVGWYTVVCGVVYGDMLVVYGGM